MKSKIAPVFILLLSVTLNSATVMAREPYWDERRIELLGLTEQQILVLESTIRQLQSLEPGELKIDKGIYNRLSHFKELFGFSFNGRDLSRWLLSRIQSISYENSWTAAANQNQGDFFVGDLFFKQMSPLERLYSLIHEARHSDDDGYKHTRCPKGFRYISSRQPDLNLEKVPACDNSPHGAYAFQAAFLFELFAFGLFEQDEAGLLYNSSISRVIP